MMTLNKPIAVALTPVIKKAKLCPVRERKYAFLHSVVKCNV